MTLEKVICLDNKTWIMIKNKLDKNKLTKVLLEELISIHKIIGWHTYEEETLIFITKLLEEDKEEPSEEYIEDLRFRTLLRYNNEELNTLKEITYYYIDKFARMDDTIIHIRDLDDRIKHQEYCYKKHIGISCEELYSILKAISKENHILKTHKDKLIKEGKDIFYFHRLIPVVGVINGIMAGYFFFVVPNVTLYLLLAVVSCFVAYVILENYYKKYPDF